MKKLIRAVLGVALLVALLVMRAPTPNKMPSRPKQMAPDRLIEHAGQYASPSGAWVVDISEENEGELKFFLYQPTEAGQIGHGPTKPFRSDSDWFMCWDSQDRLWTYIPDHTDHCTFYYDDEHESGSVTVGDGGGWEGIPASFLARLPGDLKATYEAYVTRRWETNSVQESN